MSSTYSIYTICCKDANIKYTYIGSTINFNKRRYNHKYDCTHEDRRKYNIKLYRFIRENGGWDNWEMKEIEKFECNSVDEATKRERFWFEKFRDVLNVNNPNRPPKEYYRDNCQQIIQKNKMYYEQNKESINSKRNEHFTCECGSCYTLRNKTTHFKTRFHNEYIKNKQ